MKIPRNLSLGRACWVWGKAHALILTEAEAKDVVCRFGDGKWLYAIPWDGNFLLRNAAGCFISHLYDDEDQYFP